MSKVRFGIVGLGPVGNTVFDAWYANIYSGGSMTYTFTANAAESYFLDMIMNSGVAATLDITVNGELVANDVAVPVNSWLGGSNPKQKTFALIDVVEGENTITVARGSDSLTFASGDQVQIAKLVFCEAREDIASNPMTFALQSGAENMVVGGVNTATASDIKIDQTGSITKTIVTKVEKEYILQINAGTAFADGRVLAVSVNGQSLGNFTVPNTGSPDTKNVLTIGAITLNPGNNTIAISRPSTSAGGQVGVGSIILTTEEFTLTPFTTDGETGITSVTAKAIVTSETNAVMVVVLLDANGMILNTPHAEAIVQRADNSVTPATLTVTTEGISGTVDRAQAFLWDCGAEASPSIFNTTMIELMPMCESLND